MTIRVDLPIRCAAAALIALAVGLVPITLSPRSIDSNAAFAKGGGGGGGGDGGGGGGGGSGSGAGGGGGSGSGGSGGGGGGAGGNSGNAGGNSGNAGGTAGSDNGQGIGVGQGGSPGKSAVSPAATGAIGGKGMGKSGGKGPSEAQLTAALAALNAAHANPQTLANAAPNSRTGMLATYSAQMRAAIVMPSFTPQQIAARNEAITAARAVTLSNAAYKSVTPQMVEQVDQLLGLPPTNPNLGARP